jgi:secreted PhoX family phosphatase
MGQSYDRTDELGIVSNPRAFDANPLSDALRSDRRFVLKASAAAIAAFVAPSGALAKPPAAKPMGFTGIPVSTADTVIVPHEYSVSTLYRWGDPVGATAGAPAFKPDASNTAAEQLLQAGMHHDGMHYFPLDKASKRGLLAINHEYTDDGLLHTDGQRTWTAEKVAKSQAAHGVSVIEVAEMQGTWQVVKGSRYARRITGNTPMVFTGPAAGSPLLRTAADPEGRRVLGTLNNCANGFTPWGTYLTCEENFNGYFSSQATPNADERRYGLRPNGWGYRWHEHDERFDAAKNPNEPNRFGWVVEIDPMDPTSTPIKRTALGRIKHEGAMAVQLRDGRVAVYMGDDERFEYVYKFVSRDKVKPGGFAANKDLLDHGTLYVARFDVGGTGVWLPLVHGEGRLTAANGFASQADICVKTRQAADAVGATPMDRPEWTAVLPTTGEIYVTLTNNSERGQPGRAGVDAANPRPQNIMGHIVKWRESVDFDSTAFRWSIFNLAGDAALADANQKGNIQGDKFGSPDGLWIDPNGLMWIQTDVSASALNRGPYAQMGNNQMLVANTETGQVKRFLTGPNGSEITGITATADMRTLFVNIQHPGEPASERSNPDQPLAVSTWPDGPSGGRPRSATLVIRRKDGGVVGT